MHSSIEPSRGASDARTDSHGRLVTVFIRLDLRDVRLILLDRHVELRTLHIFESVTTHPPLVSIYHNV